ncbi:MAG TPA: response regulator [Patescibacteria group bacterium]|nr:response regulator [Patescibacteria group bacterium]
MSDSKSKKYRILLVEDDAFISDIYAAKFKKEGFVVFTALDGEIGLEVSKKELPDIILLDILMPKMDGFQVLTQLKELNQTKKIPVILLSNLGQAEDVKKGFTLGAEDFLIKAHFVPQDVVKRVETLLKLSKKGLKNV